MEEAPVSEHLQKVCAFFFQQHRPQLQASKEAMARVSAVPSDQLENTLSALVSTLLQVDRGDRAMLEKLVVDSGAQLVMYVEHSRFDETPLRVRQQHQLETILSHSLPEPSAQSTGRSKRGQQSTSSIQKTLAATSASKLLAVENRFLMLVRAPVLADASDLDDRFLCLRGTSLTSLHLLEKASGSCQQQCLKRSSGASSWSSRFPLKLRVSTSDQAGANFLAEKMVLGARKEDGSSWSGLHLPCNVHIVAGAFRKTFRLLDTDVTGMVNVALFLSVGSNMLLFRQTLTQVVTSKLQIVMGYPTPEMNAYREHILNTFCSAGRGVALKRCLLAKLANGDWQRKDIIQVFIPPGVDYAEDQILENLCTGLLLSLAGSLFSIYPRHRWLGADATVEQVGLCEAVHGLLSTTLHLMLQSSMTSSVQAEAEVEAPPLVAPPASAEVQGQDGQQFDEHHTEAHVSSAAGGRSDEQPPSYHPPFVGEAEAPDDWRALAEQNAVHRQKAAAWMDTSPLPRLMVIRAAMKPLAQLLDDHLLRGSDSWEHDQRSTVATAVLSGADDGVARQSALLEYLHLTSEKRFFEELEALRQDHQWAYFQESQKTRSFQCLIFRLLSTMGCLVQELLVVPTTRFPLQLFKIVEGGTETADRFYHDFEDCPCIFDECSKTLLQRYPEQALGQGEGLAVLKALAHSTPVDTAHIERAHGRVSRILRSQSVQTRAPTFSFLNAQQVCLKFKDRSASTLTSQAALAGHRRTGERHATGPGDRPSQRKRRGGGGPWRAFLSQTRRGVAGSTDFSQQKTVYREIKAEAGQQWQQLQDLGAAGTQLHKATGQPSFGQPQRQIQRKLATQAAQQQVIATDLPPERDLGELLRSGDCSALSDSFDLASDIKVLRGQTRQAAKHKRISREAKDHSLARFVSEQKGPSLETALHIIPELATVSDSMHIEAFQDFSLFQIAFDNIAKAQQLTSWILANSRTCNLKKSLSEAWQAANAVVQHKDSDAVLEEPVARGHKACEAYGLPLCTLAGRKTYYLRNRFLKQLKTLCQRKDQDYKGLLHTGFVVVRLSKSALSEESPAASRLSRRLNQRLEDLGGSRALAEGALQQMTTLWLHVGLHYWKPYRPTFQRLDELGLDQDHMKLRQSGEFFNHFDLFSGLPKTCKWSSTLHRLVSSEAPVAELQPACCWVEAIPGAEDEVWTGALKRRGPGLRRAGRQAKAKSRPSREAPSAKASSSRSAAAPTPERQEDEGDSRSNESSSEMADEAASLAGVAELAEPDTSDSCLEDMLQHILEGQQAETVAEDHFVEGSLLDALLPAGADGEEAIGTALAEAAAEDTGHVEAGSVQVEEPTAERLQQPPVAEAPAPAGRPAPRAARSFATVRGKSEYTVQVPGGKLSYYSKGSFFQAICSNPAHKPRCVLSRSAEEGRKPSQGRPVGLLLGWLAKGEHLPNKEAHWMRDNWPSQAERLEYRLGLPVLEGGADLLLCEREKRPDEPEEPEELP